MEPLYLMIKNDLLGLIESGTYHEGELLPSEDELAESYGVSRPTVRRAIQQLVDAGYLERRPYHGVMVCPPRVEQRYPGLLRSFNKEMEESHKIPSTKVILARRGLSSAEISSRLEVPNETEIFKLIRLRYADDMPNVLVSSYIPYDLYPTIDTVDFATTSLYDYFESTGRPVAAARRRLEVLLADSSMATLLNIPKNDPVYRFYTTAREAGGRVVEYTVATYRGRSNAFEFESAVECVRRKPEPTPPRSSSSSSRSSTRPRNPLFGSADSDLIG